MNDDQLSSLQWIREQQIFELRSSREAEEKLFSWATSIFLAGLGLLTGLRGTNGSWSFLWRIVVMFGVVSVIGSILVMAFLLRRKQTLVHSSLARSITQFNQPPFNEIDSTDQIFFLIRWGAVGLLGLVTLSLVWMLG
jgi:hypothetical protein